MFNKETTNLENQLEQLKQENEKLKLELDAKINISPQHLEPFMETALANYCGLYEPKHVLNTTTKFKQAIKQNTAQQKKACIYNPDMNLNSFNKKLRRLALKSFNLECDNITNNLSGYNLDSSKKQLIEYANEMNNLLGLATAHVITKEMVSLKLERLELETDYILFQAEEKQKKYEQARKIREQKKADKEWEIRLNELQERELNYIDALSDDPQDERVLNKKQRVEQEIEEARKMLHDQKAGWIYIIENPDMEKGMLKIGLTRRPNPLARITELSNASHAFKFKVHAFIYSDDCFALETALHRRFSEQRVNKDNYHKEFFYVTPEEVQDVLKKEFDIDCAMVDNVLEDDNLLEQYYNFTFDEED
jgi:hypothetical protein